MASFPLSKPLLKRFVHACVEQSKELAHGHAESSGFTHQRVAEHVHDTRSPHAGAWLSKALSTTSSRQITDTLAARIIAASENLLRKQYARLHNPNDARRGEDFLRRLRQKLGLRTVIETRIQDFRLDTLLETALTPEDFGLPDLVEWRGDAFDFAAELPEIQTFGIQLVVPLVQRIGLVEDVRQRLNLLKTVISNSLLNHPGTPLHEEGVDLAHRAADRAGLGELCFSGRTPDDIRFLALRLQSQLAWCHHVPTLDSPCNYMLYASRNQRLSPNQWTDVQPHLDQSIYAVAHQHRIHPKDSTTIRELSSILSLKARLLVVHGETGKRREADRLAQESVEILGTFSQSYGFIYPIVRAMVDGDQKAAIQGCERAMTTLAASGGQQSSLTAFAALLFQITGMNGAMPTQDAELRRRAKFAVTSRSICYQYSHCFDARLVRFMLKMNPGKLR